MATLELVLRYNDEVHLHCQHSGLWVSVLYKSVNHAGICFPKLTKNLCSDLIHKILDLLTSTHLQKYISLMKALKYCKMEEKLDELQDTDIFFTTVFPLRLFFLTQ